MLLTVETADGDEHDVYVKPSGRPEVGIEGMANELLAAQLAHDLGVPVNEPFLVWLDPVLIKSIPDRKLQSVLENSSPLAFGSRSAGNGWRDWHAGDRVTAGRIGMAIRVLAFDVLINNRDRNTAKPNILVKGDEFRVIDHELAFKIRLSLFPRPEPWKTGYCRFITSPESAHLFGHALKGSGIGLETVRHTWSSLQSNTISAYSGLLPAEWSEAQAAVDDAIAFLLAVREKLDSCLAELERALA
ncbi:HipA family kinase [Azospirillum doebereinerae]|uniref:HipA family kinase n=1 Tax=Azospirillum doebereinerae TaxID=92933 RepID=UPI001EE571E7|nr:HipA family kinase [Azospirillum doebereinerae]MCG5241898.1 hypothetical protein [Azospirillum doebereinerae]